MDFLQDRKFRVEQTNLFSETKHLDRGCVQGSVLGPRLFSLYVGELETELQGICPTIKVVSYADDTYVVIQSDTWDDIGIKTERIINHHVDYLKNLGMTVNEAKTEIMLVGNEKGKGPTRINIKDSPCVIKPQIKVLGIIFDKNLKWDAQADHAIQKGRRLISVFRHVRRYLSESQFLKTVTCNFYSSVYYASGIWFDSCKASYKTKLSSLHFRLLRTACKDYWCKIKRPDLTRRCMKATPAEWSRYATASIAIKIIRDKAPQRLHQILSSTYYSERRNVARGLFFDSSKTRIGKQSIQNRLLHIAQIKDPWNEVGSKVSNDCLRMLLKKTYFSCQAQKLNQ
jgi:hypothetical protein